MRTKAGLLPTLFVIAVGFAPPPLSTVTTAGGHNRWNDDERDERQNERRSCGRVFAINAANELLTLDADANPSCPPPPREHRRGRVGVQSRMQIVGLAPGEQLVGIDFRPRTGQLYGVGHIPELGLQLYIIDPETAFAMTVGVRNPLIDGTRFGFDFNPAVEPDHIRVTNNSGQNVRMNPDTGASAFEGVLRYAAGDPNFTRPARVTGVAYTNPDNDPLTHTVLYNIDAARESDPLPGGGDVLAMQVPPVSGQLHTVGRLLVDTEEILGFDIGPGNGALAALQLKGRTFSDLFRIDLLSGRATHLGRIGSRRHRQDGELITGLAIELGTECDDQEEDDDDR